MTAPARIGRYTVIKALGEGHFGAVWLGEGEVPGKGARAGRFKKVAIKQLRGEWTMKGFETLVREFELLQRVHHRSLCKVYEFLDRDSAVVMEYVEGVTLREVIEAFAATREPVWPDAALAIGCELADCLYQASSTPGPGGAALGLVHRDLKPENVMLTPTGEVKVLDFGLARIDDGVREHGVKGTPLYMAPEQALGGTLDHRTDLFAVGLVVFELLTSRAAYPVPSRDRESVIDALMSRIERADLASDLASLKREYPRAGEVVARCLAAEPQERPDDGHVLLRDLTRCIEQKGALAEFAAYAFGPVGPLKSKGLTPPAETPKPADARPSRSAPAPRPADADMMGAAMPDRADPPRPNAPPPRPSAGGSRPRPAARPQARSMWSPQEKGAKAPVEPAAPAPAPPPGQDLRMVPLHEDGDDEPASSGKSATEFFALPTPKRVGPAGSDPAGRSATGEEPVTPLRRTDPIAVAGAPAGPPPAAAPVAGPPGGYVPMGATPAASFPGSHPGIAMAPMSYGIQGPVAAGPSPYGGMGHSAQLPPDLQQDVQRAQSYRVFAIVAGLMFMVFSAVIVVVVLMVGIVIYGQNQPTPGTGPVPVAGPPPAPKRPIDTGVKAPPITPITTPKPGPKPSAGPKPGPKPPPEPPPPAMDPAQVTITLAPGSPPFTSVEIRCPSGFRERGDFVSGVAKVPGVPRESCDALFKGGPPSKAKVSGGDSKSCSFVGVAANCN